MQIEASQKRIGELEEQIRHQPMSAKDAQDLHQNIEDSEDMLNKNRLMQEESRQRVSELQMQHNRYTLQCINSQVRIHIYMTSYLRVLNALTIPHMLVQFEKIL